MVINNIEVKKDDCIIGCATEPDGFHYMLAFAFKVGDIVDGKMKCMFHEISSDDHDVGYYPEQQTFEKLYFYPAYDIYMVPEETMNDFISEIASKFQTGNYLDEDEVWYAFEQANKNAIKTIQKYRD